MKWVKWSTRKPESKILRARMSEHGSHSIDSLSVSGEDDEYILIKGVRTFLKTNVEWLDESASEWISVEDDLPDFDTPVLWVTESGNQFVEEIDHDNDWENFQGTYRDINGEIIKITHWRSLPENPQSI
jgi:Protein of unknown function (DUF551)